MREVLYITCSNQTASQLLLQLVMSEYWVSQAKFYCKFCNVWIADNKPVSAFKSTIDYSYQPTICIHCVDVINLQCMTLSRHGNFMMAEQSINLMSTNSTRKKGMRNFSVRDQRERLNSNLQRLREQRKKL